MSRYIDPIWLYENVQEQAPQFAETLKDLILVAPSIDIVRCGECIFADEDAKAEMYRCLRASFPYWHTADHSCSDGFRDSEKPNN